MQLQKFEITLSFNKKLSGELKVWGYSSVTPSLGEGNIDENQRKIICCDE